MKKVCVPLLLLFAGAAAADEIGEALDASIAAQRAARESQQRVERLHEETRALQERRRAAEWQAQQRADHVARLEQGTAEQEQRRALAEQELQGVLATGAELLPLARRMLAELEAHLAADVPFLAGLRRERIAGLKLLIDDPKRGAAEKFRRVLEAWRSEVAYGYAIGAEDAATDCAGAPGESTRVHVGRVGFYCVGAGQAARWDARERKWAALDSGDAAEIARAAAMARERVPAALLVLPVAQP